MRRALLVAGLAGVVACGGVKIQDYRRPFACDHNGGDGGVQCATGWACGFDDRCFDEVLDGGQVVTEWRCELDGQCPADWRCGEEVDSQRFCQQLGVGAPSRCATDDAGCQGGWRCGAASRCFDPSVVDGGTERECTRTQQCPDRFRCGEGVTDASVSHCIEIGVGAASTCHSDLGCEGAWRCDTFATHCVLVTDVVTSGRLADPGFTLISPLSTRGVPLKFAITRVTSVPSAFGGSAAGIGPFTEQLQPGVLLASLYPDGLLVTAQLTNSDMVQVDGGHNKTLFDKLFPLRGSPADVTDLVATTGGPVVRYRDGGVEWVFDGGRGSADFLRQVDSLDPSGTTRALVVDRGNATISDLDGGSMPYANVQEVVAFESRSDPLPFTLVADAGLLVPDGGVFSSALPRGPSLGVVAGFTGDLNPRRPSFFVQVPRAIGGPELVAYTATNNASGWEQKAGLSACPDGGAALQLAFDEDSARRPALVSRCRSADGGAFPVLLQFNGSQSLHVGVAEDQVPFRDEAVFQTASPFIRAHAAASGRVWHTLDPDGYGLVGHQSLRPLVLDRQPDTVVSVVVPLAPEQLYAQSQGYVFKAEQGTGMVSSLAGVPVTPLFVIPTNPDWILTDQGVIDLLHSAVGPPRLMAVMPAGHVLTAPAVGISARLQRGSSLREVILASSSDTIWVADVTEAMTDAFAQPATFEAVLVPVTGVRLRSMTLEATADGGLSGYLTTSTQNLRFTTSDLVRWSLNPVAAPVQPALPLEVWTENGKGRTGFSDGQVWSLPIMVPLTQPLVSRTGSALAASDFGRKCGDLFAATAEGVFRAEPSATDGGLPSWNPIDAGTLLDTLDSLRFYETRDRLFVATQTGRVVELSATCP